VLQNAKEMIRDFARIPWVGRARDRERRFDRTNAVELAACAIFREESPFLDEWLTFHIAVGFQHFYLYNNFSTDNFREVLDPWISAGIVTLKDWPVAVGQLSAYRDCLRTAWKKCRWLAFFDIDEFLFCPSQVDIRDTLRQYESLAAIHIWQAFYGSSGHVSRPESPVTEAYLHRAPLTTTSIKSIANPRLIYRVGIHESKYVCARASDTSGRSFKSGINNPTLDVLRINHYWSRSLADLRTKVNRGDASTSNARNLDWHLDFEKKLNLEFDDSILSISRSIRHSPNFKPVSFDRSAPQGAKVELDV
jgi:hypothetical protein